MHALHMRHNVMHHLPGFKVFDIINGAVVLAPFRIIPFDTNPYACMIRDLIFQTNEKENGEAIVKITIET